MRAEYRGKQRQVSQPDHAVAIEIRDRIVVGLARTPAVERYEQRLVTCGDGTVPIEVAEMNC